MNEPILDMIQRARDMGMDLKPVAPLRPVPDVQALLGVPMDPQLADLYRITNGLSIADLFFIYPVRGEPLPDLQESNVDIREVLDYLPFAREVLVWAGYDSYLKTLACIPALSDDQRRQPVVILNAHDSPYIMPLASTVNRAVELIVTNCILMGGDYESREPLPYDLADSVARDTRLMQLIDAGAFHKLGVDIEEEWLDMLRAARDRADPDEQPGEQPDQPA